MRFQIGDRVVCKVNHPDNNMEFVVGSTGTVCSFYGAAVGVCWDNIESGQTCDGACEDGRGWIVSHRNIDLEEGCDEPFEFDEDAFRELLFSR